MLSVDTPWSPPAGALCIVRMRFRMAGRGRGAALGVVGATTSASSVRAKTTGPVFSTAPSARPTMTQQGGAAERLCAKRRVLQFRGLKPILRSAPPPRRRSHRGRCGASVRSAARLPSARQAESCGCGLSIETCMLPRRGHCTNNKLAQRLSGGRVRACDVTLHRHHAAAAAPHARPGRGFATRPPLRGSSSAARRASVTLDGATTTPRRIEGR